jgi:hypothetical protein
MVMGRSKGCSRGEGRLGVWAVQGRIVADPGHEEEALMGGSVSVVVDQQQRLLRKWYLDDG